MASNETKTILRDRYELESLIARGGMAEVYLALDTQLNRRVAVKILFPEYAREQSFVERFRREAQAAANLNHPNIVAIYDWGQTDGTYFIVMEYVKGQTLREKLAKEGQLDSNEIAEYSSDAASALAYAHQHGVVHRDIKPGNILITENGKVKVTDFGIARAGTSEALTQTGSVMGTATYFSPEQAQGYSVDGRSDIYSLGVVMYELATGAVPFTADTPIAVAFKHVSEKLVPPSVRNPNIAPDFEAIIMRCLEKDPDKRYATANDVHEDCISFIRHRPVMATTMPVASLEDQSTILNPTVSNVDTGRTQAVPTVAGRAINEGDGADSEASNAYAFSPDKQRKGPTIIVISMIVLLVLAVAGVLFATAFRDSSPSGPVELPDVIGLSTDDARKQLSELGFEVEVEINVNEDVDPGIVYSQDPSAGTMLRPGNTVTILVSAGVGEAEVPDVSGLTFQDASIKLAEQEFNAVLREEESDSVEKDRVIRTSPRAGSSLARGSEVEVFVSLGPASKTVLNVIGLDATTAAAQLGREDFEVVTEQEASDTVAVGKVIRTNPAPNTSVARGSTVTIFVSTGPAQVTVPNVVGQTRQQATATLQNAGLQVIVSLQPSDTVDENDVISQSPASGTRVNRGTSVNIVVSSG